MMERRKNRSSNGVRYEDRNQNRDKDKMGKHKPWTLKRLFPYIVFSVSVVWLLIMVKVSFSVDESKANVAYNAKIDLNQGPVLTDTKDLNSFIEKYDDDLIVKKDVKTNDSYLVDKNPKTQRNKNKMKVLHPHPGLGEAGAASLVDVSQLTPERKRAFENGDSVHHFNEFVSDLISVHRSVQDFRNPDCQAAHNVYPKDLPSVSVIICFYNEAWSTLVRTVHSVLDRTPVELLHEILLVDDGSDSEELKYLDIYIQHMPQVHLIRTKKRLGLVRARIEGIKFSTAPVLVFLDSHCECGYGWLEPLLAPIKADRSAVVTPTIDVIDKDDFRINNADNNIGGFSAESMTFNWITVPPRINRLRKTLADPFVSPTLAGGLFAIDKEYFLSIGMYDTGLEVWGGENLELSLKLWLCGGKIYISPCSRVGHVFRLKSPYVNVGDSFLTRNAARVAEVWMNEYSWFHYKTNPYDPKIHGDVTEAKALREQLHCKHFDWYLNVIYPELFISGSGDHFGMISHKGTGLCVLSPQWETALGTTPCATGMLWEDDKMLEVRHDVWCWDYYPDMGVYTSRCTQEQTTQVWSFREKDGSFYHHSTDTCLTMKDDKTLDLAPCTSHISQQWNWPRNGHFHWDRRAAAEMNQAAGW